MGEKSIRVSEAGGQILKRIKWQTFRTKETTDIHDRNNSSEGQNYQEKQEVLWQR